MESLKTHEFFTGFYLTTCDSYFTILVEVFTNHFSAKNTFHGSHSEKNIKLLS